MADRDRWRVVPAAGGVLWRDADAALESGGSAAPDTAGSATAGIEVALVHRPKYDDWSLPKGKLLPAEQPIVGGVREVAEETGITAMAGRPLGEMRYPVTVDGAVATKVVHYWAMRAQSGRFAPCAEVDQMQWLSPAEAAAALSYDHDHAPLQRRVVVVVAERSRGLRRREPLHLVHLGARRKPTALRPHRPVVHHLRGNRAVNGDGIAHFAEWPPGHRRDPRLLGDLAHAADNGLLRRQQLALRQRPVVVLRAVHQRNFDARCCTARRVRCG